MNFLLLTDFIVAIAIGGLVGIEREIYQQKKTRGFAGIRTYLVVAILGAICSYLSQQAGWDIIGYIVLSGIILILIASYYASALKGYMGLTTELSVILVYILSSVAMIPQYQEMAVIFAVLLAILLSMKEILHSFARKTKQIEWYDTLKFVFMVFVILPLLPNKDFTVLGVEGAFNPYNTWMMVIFVSGVSFVGYVISKVVGGSHGIGLTGVFGGLVSSTAVTHSTAQDSKKNPGFVDAYAFAAVAACIVKLFRVVFEVWIVDFSMLSLGALPLLVMALGGIVVIARWIEGAEQKGNPEGLNIGSPLTLKPALVFGFLYSAVGFLTHLFMMFNLSSLSFVLVGIVSGIADVDAVTLSMTKAFSQGSVTSTLAWQTIVSAVLSNTIFKVILAKASGSKKFFMKVGLTLVFMAGLGLFSLVVQFL